MSKTPPSRNSFILRLSAKLIWLVVAIIGFAYLCQNDQSLIYQQNSDLHHVYDDLDVHQKSTDKHSVSVQSDDAIGKVLGSIEIPAIRLKIPVYAGSTDRILDRGSGLIEGTSPLDGKDNHNSLVSGHTGLSVGRLFTQLPKLKLGDKFFVIRSKHDIYEYKIVNRAEPKADTFTENPLPYLPLKADKSFVTLLTCTPIYVNDHRLLLRGERINYNPEDRFGQVSRLAWYTNWRYWVILAVIGLLILTIVYDSVRFYKLNRKDSNS